MVSWNVLIALLLLAFALPYFYLRTHLSEVSKQNRSYSAELDHLRALLKNVEAQQDKEKSLFLEALGVPFLLVKPSGRLVMANSKAGETLGIDPKCNMNLLRMLPESQVKEMIASAVQTKEHCISDVTLKIDGEERIFRTSATPLGNENRHIGIVFRDITEEQRTQIIRKEFVANASHELRTPLTIVRGYVEMLLDSPEMAADEATRTHSLELMKKHSDRIVNLVEDMLTVSRLENSERNYLKQEDFFLNDVVNDVSLRLEGLITRQKCEVRVDLGSIPFAMRGDKFYWSQILFNLMENALKNNPAPGLKLEVAATRGDECGTTITVQDNGIGIRAEALPFVFNRFYRADTTGKVKGTGLGLSIVKHAVEAHGGRISVSSIPGVKTTFRISLPAQG